MKMQRIFPLPGPVTELDFPGHMERTEKNWSPIWEDPASSEPRFLFSRTVEPHQVVSCGINGTCAEAAVSSNPTFFDRFKSLWRLRALHLGTNAVKLPNGKFAAIFHGLVNGVAREYLNFVYVFEGRTPWRILGVASKPLELPLGTIGSGFAWTSHLAWLDGKFAISYCVKDRTSSFFIVAVKTLLADLETTD
jgi:hypothetical protein